MSQPGPRLANIRLHPVKSLDPVLVAEARVGPAGGLELDRAWALYTVDNRRVNGKRTPAILRIRAAFAPDLSSVTLSALDDRRGIPLRQFAFPQDTEGAAEWFSVYFEQQILVRHARNGFPDDAIANGPTIISTGSLRSICMKRAVDFAPRSKSMAAHPRMRKRRFPPSGRIGSTGQPRPTRCASASAK
jgi:uncharacterized protein YcbX